MKVVAGDSVTIIYPFVREDATDFEDTAQIMAFPDGTVRFSMVYPAMSAQAARTLAEALLHAVNIAQNGPK